MSNRLAMEPSEIVNYYKNKSIFITGATGFLGKVLIEKLLRSCPDVKKIYVLVRHKKGNTPQQRVNEILNCPLFELVSQFNPDFRSKLEAIEGDLVLPSMGISPEDEQKLIENVNIVFHSAATVRFDEPIKVAVQMNIIGTRKVIDLSKRMSNLEAFVHVSTAYANCNRRYVSELVYNPPVHPERIIECTDWISEDLANHITPSIIRPRPNTYTYTKAIAETLVVQECRDQLPCAIVRPSIVGASWKEPFPGWIDNFNGPTALFAAIGKGILRTMIGNSTSTADIIPVDFPVNMMIVSAWATAKQKNNKEIRVYNSTTGQINKLTWGMVELLCRESMSKNPLENIFLVPNPSFTPNRLKKFTRRLIEELLPSYIMDLYLKIIGKKPIFVRLQNRISKAVETLEYFTSTEWEFTNENVFNIENEMNEQDRKIFSVNVKDVNWPIYIENYCLGVKKYLLKEDMTKLNKCRKALANLTRFRNVVFALGAIFLLRLVFFRHISFRRFFRFIFMMALSTAVRVRDFFHSKLPVAF